MIRKILLPAKASRIEIVGIDSSLGIVDVEEDGSFYLKIIADKPFRIQTVDAERKGFEWSFRMDLASSQ